MHAIAREARALESWNFEDSAGNLCRHIKGSCNMPIGNSAKCSKHKPYIELDDPHHGHHMQWAILSSNLL